MLALTEPPFTSKITPSNNEVGVAYLIKQIHIVIFRKTLQWFGNKSRQLIVGGKKYYLYPFVLHIIRETMIRCA